MKIKIRKGDTVRLISGRLEDKGKEGEVIKVIPGEERLVVQGLNQHTKHQRQVQSQGRTISPGITSSRCLSTFRMSCWFAPNAIRPHG